MLTDALSLDQKEVRAQHQEANFYRAQHARAVEREACLKEEVRGLGRALREQEAAVAEKDAQIEALKARVAWLSHKLFGHSTERTKAQASEACGLGEIPAGGVGGSGPDGSFPPRKRGQQEGAPGHGRRSRSELPWEICRHEVAGGVPRCPRCGKPYRPFGAESSDQIEWKVRLVRVVHERSCYVRDCDCVDAPGVVTAPGPLKLIPKGMFGVSFWARVLLEKYLFARPLHRVLHVLDLEGLSVSQGTITDGLRRIGGLLRPVYGRILERSRGASRWKMDETRWSVFVDVEGKTDHRWWLWVVVTRDTVVFLLEPTRSSAVPRSHLGDDPEGFLLVDRYVAYQNLGPRLLVAFCWSHIRRDFVEIRDAHVRLRVWAEQWVERINQLFARNAERVAVLSQPEAFAEKDAAVREAVAAMAEARDRELASPDLRHAPQKALESLRNHWTGATLFVDHPEIPMDNNESERLLRDPAMGRKNYFGAGSLWSGELTAAAFTILQTLLKNHIDPHKWLVAYFEACARSGGAPPADLEAFLPWNLSEERRAQWRYPREPP
jgi:transposase